MEGYSGTILPQGTYVRANYDYVADDPTSLSFRRGDVIRVLTQLESGWWDGVIRGERGWFPSNYCEEVQGEEARRLDGASLRDEDDLDVEGLSDNEFVEDFDGGGGGGARAATTTTTTTQPRDGMSSQEEAAFWIPQATPDGRLFYYNTLTGASTMHLPMEPRLDHNDEVGQNRAGNFEESRMPPEMLAGGYEKEDDTDVDQSASETEDMSRSRGSLNKKRRSYLSDGVSPATSMDSFTFATNPATSQQVNNGVGSFTVVQQAMPPNGVSKTSFMAAASPADDQNPQAFYDASPGPLTWNRLMDDMRRSIERYRQAIENSDRSDFVRRAEDISDHLRLLLAAGSGTTDNHSGTPSIISTNKALYPHFRDMMSRFSKLVLSSHMAAADWPPADAYAKCLQEADGVLHGVYGFVDVARQQRGEDLPKVIPGFVHGVFTGANWHNNGLASSHVPPPTSFIDGEEQEQRLEPNAQLDSALLERLNELRRRTVGGIRRLEERLVLQDKVMSAARHKKAGESICGACSKVLELYKAWMTTVESVKLEASQHAAAAAQVEELGVQKQKVYVFVAELVIACQTLAAPLADEWAGERGLSFEERLGRVRWAARELDKSTAAVSQTLHWMLDSSSSSGGQGQQQQQQQQRQRQAPLLATSSSTANSLLDAISSAAVSNSSSSSVADPPPSASASANSNPAAGGGPQSTSTSTSTSTSMRSSHTTTATTTPSSDSKSKVEKFFGELPSAMDSHSHSHSHSPRRSEDVPDILRLDYEAEVQYDVKTSPPTIRGGTLMGLVEQLTRHDRFDSPFKNTFLLTYQSITTAQELFEMLVRRWNIQPPPGASPDDYELWKEKKQSLIRFRIVNIMKSWFDTYWMEGNDPASMDLLRKMLSFARVTVATSQTPGGKPLIQVLEQRLRGEDTTTKRLVPNSNVEPPPPILPKNMKKLKFNDIDATEFARQLTIIESRLYSKIKPHECLNKIWQKKMLPTDAEPAVNVKALILHSNRLTNWVAEMILTANEPKKRVAIIKHFINIADKCREMANFSTLTSIISALGTAPIHRLTRTWGLISKPTEKTLQKMQQLMGNTRNFAQYREALHQANPPCIPFFGIYLTDLTFIEDGIPSLIKRTDLINFAKRAKTAEVIREIQTYQNVSYPFKAVPELQDWIVSMMQNAGDVHEMYERSLQVEPRETGEEKIARLLSEQGFL